jgi:hypothetical protein
MMNEKPFVPQRLEEERTKDKSEVLTIRLNIEERAELNKAKVFLEQPKDSSCIKQLMQIGFANVLHDKKTHAIIDTILTNRRRNHRTGALVDEAEY